MFSPALTRGDPVAKALYTDSVFVFMDGDSIIIRRQDHQSFSEDDMRLVCAITDYIVTSAKLKQECIEKQIKDLKEEMQIPDYMKYDK